MRHQNKDRSIHQLFCRSLIAVLLLSVSTACSPCYVVRAGWEEAKILLGREPIQELIESPQTEPIQKEKFKLVLSARDFGEELGLKPKGSFTQYSEIDREVLVWVLSGSAKTSFSPVTWWFPIVGRIPYKGFFEKSDGLAEAEKLKTAGFDIYLRPSPAFSTLGWFDDPLLSTLIKFDKVSLVDTVIHEIVHNTVWVPGNAYYNETLANFIGGAGAVEFFQQGPLADPELAQLAETRLHDELLFAKFVDQTIAKLKELYDSGDKLHKEEILRRRSEIFAEVVTDWQSFKLRFQGDRYQRFAARLNNAALIAYQIYLKDIGLFAELYEACDKDMRKMVKEVKTIVDKAKTTKTDPYEVTKQRITELQAQVTAFKEPRAAVG